MIPIKQNTICLVPDGWLQVKAFGNRYRFWLEVDRGTENRPDWNEKIEGIVNYSQMLPEMAMRVLITAAPGEQRRYPLGTIRQWTQEKLEHMQMAELADLLRFSESPTPADDLEAYFTYPHWSRPFDDELHPLFFRPQEALE